MWTHFISARLEPGGQHQILRSRHNTTTYLYPLASGRRWQSPVHSTHSSPQNSSPGNRYTLLFVSLVIFPVRFWVTQRKCYPVSDCVCILRLQTGRLQQTLAGCIERTGKSLHCGKVSTVKLWPELAGKGRYFDFRSTEIPASIEFAEESPLCTTLCKDGVKIRTVEHLLSALEAMEVDNCRIEIENSGSEDCDLEVGTIFLLWPGCKSKKKNWNG